MKYVHSLFESAYPANRGWVGNVLWPVLDPRTYLRALHMLLMFPLGLCYFVFLVVSLTLGVAMIWIIVGPVILLACLFITRWLGDLEAASTGYVNGVAIRRPPSRMEGVSKLRSQVQVRLVDPTTWTGLVYLAAQWPIGVVAFACLVGAGATSVVFMFAPAMISLTGQPLELEVVWPVAPLSGVGIATFDTPFEAIPLVPLGVLGFVFTTHLILIFSSLHCWWARLMLGSRSTRIVSEPPPPPQDGGGEPATMNTISAETAPHEPHPEVNQSLMGQSSTATVTEGVLAPMRDPPMPKFALNGAGIEELTDREREVFMLMARGYTNADISEELFISEGTVKTHTKRILSKLELRDRTQLVIFAYEHGLVTPASRLDTLDLNN